MHPHLFKIPLPWGGHFTIASYGFMIMVGFLLSLYLAQRRARRLGQDPNTMFDMAIVMLLGGILGARIFYVIYDWSAFRARPLDIVRIDKGGLIFFGGLLGGAVVMFIVVSRKKLSLRGTLDLVMSAVPLGHAFGRFGCFLNGCCFGGITRSWLGVRFPRILAPGAAQNVLYNVGDEHIVGSPVFVYHLLGGRAMNTDAWSLPVHPTQLYAVGYNLLIFAVLSFLLWRRRRAGDIAWLYAVLYSGARFINEMLRADQEPLLGSLTVAQLICIPLFIFGVVMLLRSRRLPREPLPAPVQGTEKAVSSK